MNKIKYVLPALKTEIIKMKNTLGVWTTLIFPFLVVFMNFMIFYNRPKLLSEGGANPWLSVTQNAVSIYSILFLPLYIAIITFYINFNEHKSNSWRQLYTLPVTKVNIYFSKLFVSFILICVSMLFFYFANQTTLLLLKAFRPEIPFYQDSYDSLIRITFIKIVISSIGILSIQFLISIWSGNFIYPLGFGLTATFTGIFLVRWERMVYYPYSYPFIAATDLMKKNYSFFNRNLLLSIIAFAVFAAAGYYFHNKGKVK